VDLLYKSHYVAARTTNQVIHTSSLTRLGEIHHTALGDTTTKRRTRPDHRVTTHDVNHTCTYTQLYYLRKSDRNTLLLLQLSFALFRLIISFLLSSIHTHGTEDIAAMKSVQEETQNTVSDFASRTLTHQETSKCTERDIDLQKNFLYKGFYKTKSEPLPLGVPHRRLAD